MTFQWNIVLDHEIACNSCGHSGKPIIALTAGLDIYTKNKENRDFRDVEIICQECHATIASFKKCDKGELSFPFLSKL